VRAAALAAALFLAGASARPADPPVLAIQASDPALMIYAERTHQGKGQSLTLHGDGILFWNEERQVHMPAATVSQAVAALETARFASMPDSFGTGKRWLRHRVRVRTTGGSKEVYQVIKGERSAELEALVNRLFEITQPAPDAGVAVTSLADGLRKIASGELEPRALSLVLDRRTGPGAAASGWLARVQESQLSRAPIVSGRHGAPATAALPPETLRGLAAALADQDLVSLPANVYSIDYTHLKVEILRWSKDVEARQYAGMTPRTHGAAQERYDRLYSLVSGVFDKALTGHGDVK
jgi:hypothetical protein